MKERLYFCADLGTSSLKAALIDSAGCLHGFSRIHYKDSGFRTAGLNALALIDALYLAVEQLVASHSAALPPVSAIVISGSGPTLIPVVGNDQESAESLRPIYWYDSFPAMENKKPGMSLFLPRLKAFLNANPAEQGRIKYFFSSHEWLLWKLGARPVTVLPHDEYIPYYWDDLQCNALGINRELFPPFVKMGEVIGELNPSAFLGAASKLLVPGTPIIAGAADFIMALIGTGTLLHGMVCDRTGSSEGINLCVDPALCNNAPNAVMPSGTGTLRFLPHAVPDFKNISAVIPKSGILFHEYRSASGQEKKPYNELAREILKDDSHPGRPVVEEIAGSFVNALCDIEAAGYTITELTLSGGQCADSLWNQYKANRSGRTLKVPEIIHAELAGNAILCEALFSGKSICETAAKIIRIKEVYTPQR